MSEPARAGFLIQLLMEKSPELSVMNKDLILRENLAIERTKMANDRTLLSFIRTSLYFAVAGLTINSLVDIRNGLLVEVLSWVASILLFLVGVAKYIYSARKIRESRKHIGNYVFERDQH